MDGSISIILPAYNEEQAVETAAGVVAGVLRRADIPYELIFVDDGSKDGTWEAILRANAADSRVRGVSFSRNFGKDRAVFAGLSKARGDCAVVMDCDLQHPPEKIPEMVELWRQGFQVVDGVKRDRGGETPLHRLAAKGFYALLSRLAGLDMRRSSDFKLLDRKAVDALLALPEEEVFFRGLAAFVGFRRAELPFDVAPRSAGQSKWSFRALARYAVSSVTAFSTLPLVVPAILGVLFALTAALTGVLYAALGEDAEGWLVFLAVLAVLAAACLLVCLGVAGYYLGRVFRQSLGRPRYIISRECGE